MQNLSTYKAPVLLGKWGVGFVLANRLFHIFALHSPRNKTLNMTELQKKLSLYGLTMIAVGSAIGSGIFITPAAIVKGLPNVTLVLWVWALGGLVALTGALSLSELGGMFPRAGGVYAYLREAYGDLTGFLYGWVTLLVINTGALAGLCVAFAEYMKIFAPDMSEGTKIIIAAATMIGLTAINALGVSVSQGLSNFFTGLKLFSIAVIVFAGFYYYDPAKVPLDFSLQHGMPAQLAPAMLTALVGVLFSMGGWHHASYMSGEAIDAPRTVPKAMFTGVLIVVCMYLLVNLAFMMLLPLEAIAQTPKVAADAMATLAPWGAKAVAVAIAFSIFGTISIYTMSAPRIYFAMANDGVFFRQLAYLHPRWRTPVVAMVVQVVWALAVLLFFNGLFDKIITFVTFMDIVFMALAAVAIFLFRVRRPDADRPIKAWGYPVIPAIFVLISTAFAINVLLERPGQALPGMLLLLLGIAVFWIVKKR
jgi:basic amino acid/polyamine antiporter, APA family